MTMGTDCFVLKLDFVTFLDEFKCLKTVLSFKSLNAKHLQQLKKNKVLCNGLAEEKKTLKSSVMSTYLHGL